MMMMFGLSPEDPQWEMNAMDHRLLGFQNNVLCLLLCQFASYKSLGPVWVCSAMCPCCRMERSSSCV
eukprot:6534456-Karenia_brevis.AAC.1